MMKKNCIMKEYVDQIKAYPLLSADEEKDLADRIAHNDNAAKIRLVQCNLRLVVAIVQRYSVPEGAEMDLVQEGNIGLMAAASKFRSSFKTRFSTYAFYWISQYITRYIRIKNPLITLPYRKEELLRRIHVAREFLVSHFKRDPEVHEIAVYLGLQDSLVKEVIQYAQTVQNISSIDNAVDSESDDCISDLLPDYTYSPDIYIQKEGIREYVFSILSRLPKNEQLVLYYRYNLGNLDKRLSLREIADILCVSQECVRKTERRAMKRLRDTEYQFRDADCMREYIVV